MNRALIAAALAFAPLTALGAIKAEPTSDLRPPRPELPVPAAERNRQAWVLGGVAAGLFVAFLCWPRRRPPAPPPDPHAIAQEELDALHADVAKATPMAVSAIVRRYVVDAFGLEGTGLTSEEVVSGLATRRACPADLVNAAWHFLSDCDRAKFAPTAEPIEGRALLDGATSLLDQLEGARAALARTVTV
jgi:hypothetical protein